MAKRKIKITAGLVILLLTTMAFAFYQGYQRNKNTVPIPSPTPASFKGLVPGTSTESDIINKLGDPENINRVGDQSTLEYPSNNPNFNSKLTLEGGTLSLIKQIVTMDEKGVSDNLVNTYGEPRYTLFGPSSVNGFNLYVYPSQGVAFIGHLEAKLVTEIWYFQPTNYQDFKKLYAQAYSETYNPTQ